MMSHLIKIYAVCEFSYFCLWYLKSCHKYVGYLKSSVLIGLAKNNNKKKKKKNSDFSYNVFESVTSD